MSVKLTANRAPSIVEALAVADKPRALKGIASVAVAPAGRRASRRKRACLRLRVPFWPVIMTIGYE
jgi:hypothetical protein